MVNAVEFPKRKRRRKKQELQFHSLILLIGGAEIIQFISSQYWFNVFGKYEWDEPKMVPLLGLSLPKR